MTTETIHNSTYTQLDLPFVSYIEGESLDQRDKRENEGYARELDMINRAQARKRALLQAELADPPSTVPDNTPTGPPTPLPGPSQAEWRLQRVHRDDPGSASLMDQVVNRIKAFSHQANSNYEGTVTEAWTLFAQKSPLLGLWVAFEDEVLVGHLLASIKEWDGRLVGWITQAVMDRHLPKDLREIMIIDLENWVIGLNCLDHFTKNPIRQLVMVTDRSSDAWAKHAGFIFHRAVHTREVR